MILKKERLLSVKEEKAMIYFGKQLCQLVRVNHLGASPQGIRKGKTVTFQGLQGGQACLPEAGLISIIE